MKKYFTCLLLMILFQLAAKTLYGQRIYLKAYDFNNNVIEGNSQVENPSGAEKLIDVQSTGTGLYCGNCTANSPGGTAVEKKANTFSFIINNGPELIRFRTMLLMGNPLRSMYFIYTKGGAVSVKDKNDVYVAALGFCFISDITEVHNGNGESNFQITVQVSGVAYYYRRPNPTNGAIPVTPTSTITWNFINHSPTLNDDTGLLALPGGY